MAHFSELYTDMLMGVTYVHDRYSSGKRPVSRTCCHIWQFDAEFWGLDSLALVKSERLSYRVELRISLSGLVGNE